MSITTRIAVGAVASITAAATLVAPAVAVAPAAPRVTSTRTVLDAPESASLVYGQHLTLTGHVTPMSTSGGSIKFQALTDKGHAIGFGAVPVAADGSFSVTLKPAADADYQARFVSDDTYASSMSDLQHVDVASRINLNAPVGPASTKATISGGVNPVRAGATVFIYSLDSNGTTRLLAKTRSDAGSRFSVKIALPRGRNHLLARTPPAAGRIAGTLVFNARRS